MNSMTNELYNASVMCILRWCCHGKKLPFSVHLFQLPIPVSDHTGMQVCMSKVMEVMLVLWGYKENCLYYLRVNFACTRIYAFPVASLQSSSSYPSSAYISPLFPSCKFFSSAIPQYMATGTPPQNDHHHLLLLLNLHPYSLTKSNNDGSMQMVIIICCFYFCGFLS